MVFFLVSLQLWVWLWPLKLELAIKILPLPKNHANVSNQVLSSIPFQRNGMVAITCINLLLCMHEQDSDQRVVNPFHYWWFGDQLPFFLTRFMRVLNLNPYTQGECNGGGWIDLWIFLRKLQTKEIYGWVSLQKEKQLLIFKLVS